MKIKQWVSIIGVVLLGMSTMVYATEMKKGYLIAAKESQGKIRGQIDQINLKEDIMPKVEEIHIVSVGDIMMHDIQITGGYDTKNKIYDYNYMFEEVKKYIEEADVAIGNLELTMAGSDKGGYTGYPCFNAPDELADALKNIGIDVLSTANNHSLDRRFYGIERTINVLDEKGIAHTGTFKTKDEQNDILIQEVKGTTIAFLSYTYGTNGIGVDKGKEYSVNYINKEQISRDIKKAKEVGAELVCVSMHYGEEYVRTPNKSQKDLVDFLVTEGVDIILGNHPHVLQPVEIRNVEKDGVKKEVAILYSQGNFVSAQRTRHREQGAIFDIVLEKNYSTNKIKMKAITYIPTWVDQSMVNGKYHFRVLPAKKSVHKYEAKQDALISADDYAKLKRALSDTRGILKTEDIRITERFTLIEE